jgi:osmotically-inducible protein OsmY
MLDPVTNLRTLGVMKMKQHSGFRNCLLVGTLLLAGGTLMLAQDSAGQSAPASDNGASDNTKANQQDRNSSQPTADQQPNTRSDRDLTQQIRQAITADKTFSTYAHNVKVITQGGQVTLRGPVRSEDEKRAVEAKAASLAGDGKVTSELTVKPKS